MRLLTNAGSEKTHFVHVQGDDQGEGLCGNMKKEVGYTTGRYYNSTADHVQDVREGLMIGSNVNPGSLSAKQYKASWRQLERGAQ